MKKIHMQTLTILSLVILILSACDQTSTTVTSDSEPIITEVPSSSSDTLHEPQEQENTSSEESYSQESYTDNSSTTEENVIPSNAEQINQPLSKSTFSLSDIVPYSDQPYIVVNNNIPYFSDSDLTEQSYEFYSGLDALGRCGVAYANIGIDIMPTEERGEIGQIRPSGWHTIKYNDLIDGNYLYNRCHLIGYQLSGENANVLNLITGTRYLNVEGMLPFENMVTDYVKETENHVLYRVTPIFDGDNLLASGVLMEGKSVEDKGEGILFCVYVYNVQPGITIDYATGESAIDESKEEITPEETSIESETKNEESQVVQEATPETNIVATPEPQGTDYILNTNTKKFHYPTCSSVGQMKESNKEYFTENRDDVIARGFDPCKRCNP